MKFAEVFRDIVDVMMIICKKEGREEEWEKLRKLEWRKEPKFEQKLAILMMVHEELWKMEGVVPLVKPVPKGPVPQLPV